MALLFQEPYCQLLDDDVRFGQHIFRRDISGPTQGAQHGWIFRWWNAGHLQRCAWLDRPLKSTSGLTSLLAIWAEAP